MAPTTGASQAPEYSITNAGESRICVHCGLVMGVESRFCPFCHAEYTVHLRGYCLNCHDVVDVDGGKCIRCGQDAADAHYESELHVTPDPAPAAQADAASPPSVPRKSSRLGWLLAGAGVVGLILVLLVLVIFSGTSPQAAPTATRRPAPTRTPNIRATVDAINARATQDAESAWVDRFSGPILEEVNGHTPNFADDFSDLNGRFSRWGDLAAGVSFTDGIMRINTAGTDWASAGGSLNASDFVLRFDFTPRTISDQSGIYVDFRCTDDGCYNFGFNLFDDWWGMGYMPGGVYQTVSDGSSDEVGPDRRTSVIVIASGNEFAFYANGRPILHATHRSLQGEYVSIGVWAPEDVAEVDFDNVQFWDLNNLIP